MFLSCPILVPSVKALSRLVFRLCINHSPAQRELYGQPLAGKISSKLSTTPQTRSCSRSSCPSLVLLHSTCLRLSITDPLEHVRSVSLSTSFCLTLSYSLLPSLHFHPALWPLHLTFHGPLIISNTCLQQPALNIHPHPTLTNHKLYLYLTTYQKYASWLAWIHLYIISP